VIDNFERWQRLSPEERARIRERVRQMPPEERQRLRQMSPEERQRLRQMPPEERQRVLREHRSEPAPR